eukprot:10328382-Alexandrium_andersonii.AAC.1
MHERRKMRTACSFRRSCMPARLVYSASDASRQKQLFGFRGPPTSGCRRRPTRNQTQQRDLECAWRYFMPLLRTAEPGRGHTHTFQQCLREL